MLTPAGKEAAERFLEALKDPEGELARRFPPQLQIVAGNHSRQTPLTESRELVTVEHAPDGVMHLRATLAHRYPPTLSNAPVTVTVYVGGIPMRVFDGRASRPKTGRASTEFVASSPGATFPRTVLNEEIRYQGSPSNLMRRVIAKIADYDRSNVRVANLGRNIKVDTEANKLKPSQKVGEVVSSIEGEFGSVHRDLPWWGFEAFPDPGLGERKPPAWTFGPGGVFAFEPTARDDVLYAGVVVEREPEESTEESKPDIPGWKVYAPVRHQDLHAPPPKNHVDWVYVTGEDVAGGRRIAEARAARHAKRVYDFRAVGPLNPTLQLYDVVNFVEEVSEDLRGGDYRYEWHAVITGKTDDYGTFSSDYSGTMYQVGETFIQPPPIGIPARSLQHALTPRLPVRLLGGELVLDTDWALNSQERFWAYLNAEELVVDTDLAEGRAHFNAGGELILEAD